MVWGPNSKGPIAIEPFAYETIAKNIDRTDFMWTQY